MLAQVIDEGWLAARAVIGLFPANAEGDDILVYADEARAEPIATFYNLRKQGRQPAGKWNECLADWVAPVETGLNDYIGGFACTAGEGIDAHVARFEADHDDYSALMLKALADRLAEALAEMLHHQVRTRYWGYAEDEDLANEDLIEERYQGIRPAIGYPASPGPHREGHPLAPAGRPGAAPASGSPSPRPWCPPPRSPGSTSPTPKRATSRSASSTGTRWPTMPSARACRCR